MREARQRHLGRLVTGFSAWFGVLLTSLSPGFSEEDDPAARWVSVFGWMQTGERLAAANQWPLAMGSYLESHRQISELAAQYPDYEPELIAYRTEKLEQTIAEAESLLTSDEHAVMMKFLDFIESLELGQAQRFRNEFETALSTLDMAKSLLDEIIAKKPAEFRTAVDSQYERLESSIEWVNTQIDYKERSRRASFVRTGDVLGTTQFVKEGDLPRAEEGIEVSGSLFPMSLASIVPAFLPLGDQIIEPSGPEEIGAVGAGVKIDDNTAVPAMNFRMSSQRQMSETSVTAEKTTVPVP